MIKPPSHLLPLLATIVLFSCTTVPDPGQLPMTREEFLAAGWKELEPDPLEVMFGGDWRDFGPIVKTYHLVSIDGGLTIKDLKLNQYTGNPNIIYGHPFVKTATIEEDQLMERNFMFQRPNGGAKIKIRGRILIDKRTYTIDDLWSYEIGGKEYQTSDLTGLLNNPTVDTFNIIDSSGRTYSITRTQLFSALQAEFIAAKEAFASGNMKAYTNDQLIAAAMLLGDKDFEAIARSTEEERKKAEKAKIDALVAQYSAYYRDYAALAINAETNLAMLNNIDYWEKNTVYKFVFGGSDSERNYAHRNLGSVSLLRATELCADGWVEEPTPLFMLFSISNWSSKTRFKSSIITESGSYPFVVETGGLFSFIQQYFPSGFRYCRGYFVVLETKPELVFQPIQLGGLLAWDIEKQSDSTMDEIIRSGLKK